MRPGVAVAAPHPLAVEAAREIVDGGGNVVDAAVAAAAALTVVYPHQCSIGGDLFALARLPDASTFSVNASGAYGTADTALPQTGTFPRRGPLTVSVPGVVSGWEHLLRVAGSLTAGQVLAPAIRFAHEGTAVGEKLARAIAALLAADEAGPALRELLSNRDVLHQPRLAQTLEALATDGLGSFYTGPTGDRLATAFEQLGVPITRADLARHRAVQEDALVTELRAARVSTSRPNSQGYLLLTTLRALDLLRDEGEVDPGRVARLFAYGESRREAELADPRHMTVDVEDLLTADSIRRDVDHLSRPGHRGPLPRSDGDTVAVTAVSEDGAAVSLIQSVLSSFGSGLHDARTGITFHNRAASFSTDPGSANVVGAAKRPAHTLMPVLVELPDGTIAAHGTMGGYAQPQIHVQLLDHVLQGRSPQQAVRAPRFVVGRDRETGEESVLAEDDLDPATLEALRASGLVVQTVPSLDDEVGHAMVCTVSPGGTLSAGADPRSDGATWISTA